MNDQILEALYAAADDVNRQRSGENPLQKAPETALFGSASELDSLGLVNYIVAAEQRIEQTFGKSLILADDRALSQEPSPFSSIGALAGYVGVLLRETD
jgi:hypothetical protein